ncbi:MAG: chlorite dismutase family protein [Vicinamibacterales bacterium]
MNGQPNPRLFSFVGGAAGAWRVVSNRAVAGEGIEPVERLSVEAGLVATMAADARWCLRGVTSHERYVERVEKDQLVATQAPLGRPEAMCAAFIPIRKSSDWWALTQDERRRIFEETSHHTQLGMRYLPAIARRLHHCRDLSVQEPFDFLTWFEFAPQHAAAFDELVASLRATAEWAYVDREVDIRVIRDSTSQPGER